MRRPPGKRSTLSTRPPLDRMQQIFNEIRSGSYPNREQLATAIEVTTKTIQRDIDFMRDRLNLPIAYNPERRGYEFTESVASFPMLELTESEIVSVFIAQKALAAQRGTPFEEPLRSAYAKLVSSLNGRISVQWSDLGNGVSFRTYQASTGELSVFEAIGTAVRNSKLVSFEYKKLGASRFVRRTVEPYHLACVQGQWYCIARDRSKDGWRNFALCRMKRAVVSDVEFARDRSFSIDQYLSGSMGIFVGRDTHHVRLRFTKWGAQFIRERTWHPAQKLQELSDGGVEFSVKLSSLEEIIPWILSWGEHVRVLGPTALRGRIAKTVRAMGANLETL